MRRRTLLRAGAAIAAVPLPARSAVPADRLARMRRGINVTNWFRFPERTDPAFFRDYLTDAEIAQFRAWGFDHVRIPVQPELLRGSDGEFDTARFSALTTGVRRIQAAGLATMVELHPHRWRLETQEGHRRELSAIWQALAPRLAPLDPALTFAEILNEPVFDGAPDRWHALQAELAASIRAAMPAHTIIATGHHWGSLDGLLALRPLPDPNVVYTFHFYRPQFWTTLGSGVRAKDPDAIGRLPWPQTDVAACRAAGRSENEETRRQIDWHCGQAWGARTLRAHIDSAGDWARRHGATVIVNEIGVSARIPARYREAYLRDLSSALAANGIGWTLWGYEDVMGLQRRRMPDGRIAVREEVLRGLGLSAA